MATLYVMALGVGLLFAAGIILIPLLPKEVRELMWEGKE